MLDGCRVGLNARNRKAGERAGASGGARRDMPRGRPPIPKSGSGPATKRCVS